MTSAMTSAEAPDLADNPRVQAYLHTVQLAKSVHDETPWCSAFVNWCMEQGALRGTKSAAARSWLHWGQPLAAPKRGCIVVFTRPGMPSNGHVAMFCGFAVSGDLLVLGGNQNNKVCVKAYARARVIGYRWPGDAS